MKSPGLVALLLIGGSATAAPVDCVDTRASLAYWQPVRERAGDPALDADSLAVELVPCLASPDPGLRDGIGYELYATWLRNGALSDDTRRFLLGRLQAGLLDADTLTRSFSALVLAEIVRSDLHAPFMSPAERDALLERATAVLAAESDYRGLDAAIGWVHPVAHLADLLWRFALHPETTEAQAAAILAAVRAKVAPVDVNYVFNEPDRLARVVATLVDNESVAPAQVLDWLSGFSSPRTMTGWRDAFQSPRGMAELQNTKLFIRALSDQLDGVELDPGIGETLRSLVQGFTALI